MTHLFALESAEGTPLTKTITKTATGLETTPYPHERYFNSYALPVSTITEFHQAAQATAKAQQCLLKGPLTRNLNNESRAGSTNTADETFWVCFDVDGARDISSADEFIRTCLPPECQNVSYVWQPSASAGLFPDKGLSGHIFMILDNLYAAPLLKDWLTHINLNNDYLNDGLELARNCITLKWTLDITCCQNDKLIFVAPPVLNGIDDPIADRFVLCTKDNDTLTPDLSNVRRASNEHLTEARIAELRKQIDLPKRKPQFKRDQQTLYLANPEVATVTGPTKEARGFVYLNINGGDSYAYFHTAHNPIYLHNFKGEPAVKLEDFVPEYWYSVRERYISNTKGQRTYLAFRDYKTDSYLNGWYDEVTEQIELYPAGSKDKLEDFMSQHGCVLDDPVRDWDLKFEPKNPTIIDTRRQFINLFQPTEHLRIAQNSNVPTTKLPPITSKIIHSALGDDEEAVEYFINWLAFVYQYREQAHTAWVLQGIEGTGKGLLFHRIIKPTLGANYCTIKEINDLNDQYNEWLEKCLVLFIDEAQVGSQGSARKVAAHLRHLITEPTTDIRGMRKDPRQGQLHCNIIFASNELDAVTYGGDDRRYNVAPRQECKLNPTTEELATLDKELTAFTNFLVHYNVDLERVRQPLQNDAKEDLRVNAEVSTDRFIRAIREGDLEYFLQLYHERPPSNQMLQYQTFKEIIQRWVKQADGTPHTLARDDLRDVYAYVQNVEPPSPNKFSRLCGIHGLAIKTMRINGVPQRGVITQWDISNDTLQKYFSDNLQQARANAV